MYWQVDRRNGGGDPVVTNNAQTYPCDRRTNRLTVRTSSFIIASSARSCHALGRAVYPVEDRSISVPNGRLKARKEREERDARMRLEHGTSL